MRSTVNPAALCSAVETVLSEPAYARAAARLADEMAALPPTDDALATLITDAR